MPKLFNVQKFFHQVVFLCEMYWKATTCIHRLHVNMLPHYFCVIVLYRLWFTIATFVIEYRHFVFMP